MKKIFTSIFVLICVCSLTVSSHATTLKELKKAHSDLKTYFYTPYFEDSSYLAAYEEEMKKTEALLEEVTITQKEVDEQYTSLKKSYADLVRDIFDYSSLDLLIVDYETLDETLFEVQSFKKLVSAMDGIYKETTAPSLFMKGDTTKESYRKLIEDYLIEFVDKFQTAFNALSLLALPENITKEQLQILSSYCLICTNEQIMKESVHWESYVDAYDLTQTLCKQKNPNQARLNGAAKDLLEKFDALTKDSINDSAVEEELALYNQLSPASYTQASWKRYSDAYHALQDKLTLPYFIYFQKNGDSVSHEKSCQNYFEQYVSSTVAARKSLIDVKSYNELVNLCNKYQNAVASPGLDLKLEALLERVTDGKTTLANANATLGDFEKASTAIRQAAEDLEIAEKYLKDEQSEFISKDEKSVRMIIITTVTVLVLSLLFAILTSLRYYGRLNWRK